MLSRTLSIALNGTLPACSTVCCQGSANDDLKHTPKHALKYTLNCTRWHTPSLLDYTLPSQLTRCYQVYSEYILKYTPRHALKEGPNCARWHTPSLLGSMLPSTFSSGKTLPISVDYMLPCILPGAQCRDFLRCRSQAPGGGWWVADGVWRKVAGIMTSINTIVRTSSLACTLWQDLTMPHGHGVDNCSLGFCRNDGQFELGESRSPTQIFQQNLLPASHLLWVYVCAFSPGLKEVMAMAMAMVMAIVMMLVIVIIVPEVLGQVGWLRQRQHQSFHRPRAFY